MTARRTLLTAATAGALLGALWFVPSAKATASPAPAGAPSHTSTAPSHLAATRSHETATATHLPDSGADADTTPYVAGGTAFLGLGAGFVLYSVRRDGAEG
ncbi:LPXTG cell wall anchor domain-containing protein [Streptomyces lasiicapitis]|uniref:LPXTG cell wall anchor domain-containing protein n=1 Tax=Streptomyces lasiicapitis TaxID=1923961 RepID=UPI00368DCB47